MITLKVTQEFNDYISNACSMYKAGWEYIQKYDILNNIYVMDNISKGEYKASAYMGVIVGFHDSEGKWDKIIKVLKKLLKSQPKNDGLVVESDADIIKEDVDKEVSFSNAESDNVIDNVDIDVVKDVNINELENVPSSSKPKSKSKVIAKKKRKESSIDLTSLMDRMERIEQQLSQYKYIINELQDKVNYLQGQISDHNDSNNTSSMPQEDAKDVLDILKEQFGFDEPFHSPEELEDMKTSNIDDFESMLKTGQKLDTSSSLGVIDHHVINMADNSRNKGNEISSEPTVITSMVYDTADPTITKREVELREAKQAVANIRKEKERGENKNESSLNDNRNQRWIDAVHKNRIKQGMEIDMAVLQKDGFNYDDPANSIFKM